jgi:hypothetical protein
MLGEIVHYEQCGEKPDIRFISQLDFASRYPAYKFAAKNTQSFDRIWAY